jgi:hypothetical protein
MDPHKEKEKEEGSFGMLGSFGKCCLLFFGPKLVVSTNWSVAAGTGAAEGHYNNLF